MYSTCSLYQKYAKILDAVHFRPDQTGFDVKLEQILEESICGGEAKMEYQMEIIWIADCGCSSNRDSLTNRYNLSIHPALTTDISEAHQMLALQQLSIYIREGFTTKCGCSFGFCTKLP